MRSLLFTTFRRVSFTLREISIAATVHNLSSPSLELPFRREKEERILLFRPTGTTTRLIIYRIWHFVSLFRSVIGGTFLRKNVDDTRSIACRFIDEARVIQYNHGYGGCYRTNFNLLTIRIESIVKVSSRFSSFPRVKPRGKTGVSLLDEKW